MTWLYGTLLWNRVISTFAPGVAGDDPAHSHETAFERTVFSDGFHSVSTACGCKTALGAKKWRYGALIEFDQ